VLGSELDVASRRLVDAWASEDAVLISAMDLCTRGWVFHATSRADGWFVAAGRVHPIEALRGVVVRRPAVAAEELPWIADVDRQYATAEINAFLVAWLSALTCPVLNRPTAMSLCGPAWSQAHWQVAAARADVAWAEPIESEVSTEVVFCHRLCYGAVTTRRSEFGRRLAALTGADLLGIRFAGDAVAAVTLQPSLAELGAREIVLAHFRAEGGQ
jgi:hypothetical protein